MTRTKKPKQPRLLPDLEPIRAGDALTLDALMTRYRCRCGNSAETRHKARECRLYPLWSSHEATMTTRAQAETVLFADAGNLTAELPQGFNAETVTANLYKLNPTRHRLDATYCPTCRGWVEVRLRPVRLHCTCCGLEASA